MDETHAFGKGEKDQRVTKPRSPTRKTAARSTPARLGAVNVECEDRSFEALLERGGLLVVFSIGNSLLPLLMYLIHRTLSE
jgi:hypothetical protein